MERAEPASHPGWLPVQPAAAAPAPPPYQRHRAYAEWFAWARSQVGDLQRCHAGAAAAVYAIESGQPLPVVTEAAGKVAQGAPSIAPDADAHTRSYANWFAWANLEQKLDTERSHAAAQAASSAQDHGLPAASAAAAGLAAAGMTVTHTAQPAAAAHFNDRALWNLGWGVAALVLPFVGFVLPIAPIIGLLWGARILRYSRRPLVLAAIGVNVLALLFNAFVFIGSRLLK